MKRKIAIISLFTFLLMTQAIFAKSGSSSGTPGVDQSSSFQERIDRMKVKFPKISSQGVFDTDAYWCTALERYMNNEVEIGYVNMACHESWSEDSSLDALSIMLEYILCTSDDTSDERTDESIINNF
jgi:hypothetical protein